MDGGECQDPGECGAGATTNCYDSCVLLETALASMGNGVCEPDYNCSEKNFDGGDCEAVCDATDIQDCQGNCIPITALVDQAGSGTCQFEYYCEALEYDQGDCGPAPFACEADEIPDCIGGCVAETAVIANFGNGVCDPLQSCEQWNQDGGDCATSNCTEPGDILYFQNNTLTDLQAMLSTCFDGCAGAGGPMQVGECLSDCVKTEAGFGDSCTSCAMDSAQCSQQQCGLQCSASTTLCEICVQSKCQPDLEACIGYTVQQ